MDKIELPIGITEASFENFQKYCNHFGCQVLKPKRGDSNYIITTDDNINFFWLGMNFTLEVNTGISISAASKYLIPSKPKLKL